MRRREHRRRHHWNTPELLQGQKVLVTAYDRIRLPRDRGLQHHVVGGVCSNHINMLQWIDQMLGPVNPRQDLRQEWVARDGVKSGISKNGRQFSQQVRGGDESMPADAQGKEDAPRRPVPADRRHDGIGVQNDIHRRAARIASPTRRRRSRARRTSPAMAARAASKRLWAASSSARRSRAYSASDTSTACSLPRRPIVTGPSSRTSCNNLPRRLRASSTAMYFIRFTLSLILRLFLRRFKRIAGFSRQFLAGRRFQWARTRSRARFTACKETP